MATSETEICNLALTKLGAKRITALDDATSANARYCNAVYASIRDRLLRSYKWHFAKKFVTLAPDGSDPNTEEYDYAFVLPADFLRLLKPVERADLDWKMVNHNGARAIYTNDGDEIEVPYIARITNVALFDPLFVDALACDIASELCEPITQSNTKKADVKTDRREAIATARRLNAFESGPEEAPEDSWLSARR